MEYVSAGHPVQFLLQNCNIIELPKTGRAVGLWEKCNDKKVRLSFTKGERLILYTDGIFEKFNTNQQQYGEERLKTLIRKNTLTPMNVLINNILDDIYTFTQYSKR